MNTMTEITGPYSLLQQDPGGKELLEEARSLRARRQSRADASRLRWVWSSFDGFSVYQLYDALRLRQGIFIVEQQVPYPDIDDNDKHCMHLMGYLDDEMVAYMRLVPLHQFEEGYFSFGRVVVKESLRGSGLGRELVARGMDYLDKMRNGHPVKISSQLYLKDFYASFGFQPLGEPYIEDMIPHIAMIRADN
jgi:ElaA protein